MRWDTALPYDIHWYEPDRILLVTYARNVTVEEVNDARESVIGCLDAAPGTVHIIADWRKATAHPLRYGMRPRVLDVINHRRMGQVAIVGTNAVLAFWAELYAKRGGLRYLVAAGVEEAAQMLKQSDKSQSALSQS